MEDSEKVDSEPIPTNDDPSPSQGKSCALCGCATPAVRCDRCNSQIFCLSCDDMYHRHPKRKFHLRKAVDSIWSTARSPRLRRRTDLPGDPCKIPIPPPRSKKRERHTIGGRMFLKSGLELGSFGHSKVFDPKNLPTSKDFFMEQKSPASMVESNCDDETSNPNVRGESGQIYQNDNMANPSGNLDENDRSPWNPMRPNISSPIQVSIPSSSPDIVPNGQSFGYPAKPHSQSAADLTGHPGHPIGHHPYHFHPPYPYMHPQMHPYSHSMAHLNCAQCLSSSSWSNLVSPHPSPYFHPMPWGSAQNTLSRHPVPGQPGLMKHSHGDLSSYPDSSFHYPYHGGGYFPNGPPMVDPNFIKDLHEQAEMQKLKKDVTVSRPNPNPGHEEMDTTTNPAPTANEPSSASNVVTSTEAGASAQQDVREVDEVPPLPEKPTEPWTCVHCTFINPPGSYICDVCCKTSYGNQRSRTPAEQSEMRPMSRGSESPLINRDALLNTPEVSEFREAQKDDVLMDSQLSETKSKDQVTSEIEKLTTETQTFTTTKTTDAQTQNIVFQSIASSTDSIFPKQEISVQTEVEAATQNISVATDPMISSHSLESLLSGVSAPPYHNRRAGWGRGATSFSTQSLYERGRSRSPMPRSLSFHTEAPNLGRDSSFASEEVMHSASQAWLYTDPMYFKPHNQGLAKEDYFDGTWGSMDKLNKRVQHKKDKGKLEHVRPKLHRSLDDLKSEKRPEVIHTQELMMLQTVKEAERCGFNLEDLHVAYLHCGKENPVFWLEDNWPSMIKNVIALAAKYGEDNEENDVGVITPTEAKEALRIHRGDIWDAVAECIENRQRKILELTVRGNFTQKQISDALKHNEGNVELAYADLLRASTRRHKFILSPGLSTDSEDLNIYNPIEDSTVDHSVSISPMKPARLDISSESKAEKKKSDFLTKLTAIREAQSERRKAREEKELNRENIVAESEVALKDKDISLEVTPSISREESKEVEEIIQDVIPESTVKVDAKNVAEVEVSDVNKTAAVVKERTDDTIPVDFDTNWSESQGEWIEEYSDEQWEEGDEHWVGLGKKFQKMEKEFEEEAMQMAAMWEKEELEDDVFEEDTKVQEEVEVVAESDKKFDEWVKANLKVDSSEYEEEVETKGKVITEDVTSMSVTERLELEGSQPSPLQHYPTALDLSVKSQFESDWVDLPADAEIEKLAHDIVCEGSDIENKLDEAEMIMYEEEKPRKFSDQGSDGDWEKIEMDEQLQEVNELDRFAFPDKESEFERNFEEFEQGVFDEKDIELTSDVTSQITMDKNETVLYKNLEIISAVDASDVGITASPVPDMADYMPISDSVKEPAFIEEDQPRPPVRRKSKLNSAAIEQALKNQAMVEISSDIPPALPEKARSKNDLQKMPDVYAVPDKTKVSQEDHILRDAEVKVTPSVPQKPPRLAPLPLEKSALEGSGEDSELSRRILTKDGSPALSYESDSNFFADSESDTETKRHRQKNIHRKPVKYENEFEDVEIENISKGKLEKLALEDKSDILESNLDFELDDDIDPALIEPLPRMKDIDFDPELPILLGGRGRQLTELEDVNAPKAFRGDTTRPLQLFKAVKRETPTSTLSRTSPVSAEFPADETSFITKTNEGLPVGIPHAPFEVPAALPEPAVYENQATDRYYYNETVTPQQSIAKTQLPHKQEVFEEVQQVQPQEELVSKLEIEQKIEEAVQPVSAVQKEEEIAFTEMEGMSAAVDYFFGQYNEIVPTRPKKKTPVRIKPALTTIDKSAASPKAMSTSEITSAKTEASFEMEQSAAAVLQEGPLPGSAPPDSDILTSNKRIEKQPSSAAVPKEVTPMPDKPKQPEPTECLSFAEDYLFGCYSQVSVPRKTKNLPVVLTKIPKLGEASLLLRGQSPFKEEKPSTPTPEPIAEPTELPPEEPEEELEEMTEGGEEIIPTDTSVIYDEIFHDLPPEMLANQSFDETSIYYESFQDAVENVHDTPSVSAGVVNVRPKTVHFEEPTAPVVPPRKSKPQSIQKAKAPIPTVSSESYADEYLFRQYEQVSQAKKKLPVCSEDFRMKQGFEPSEIPCDTPLMPDEQQESVISSEISTEIPSKSFESFKYSSEYESGDSDQLLDSIKHDSSVKEITDITSNFMKSQDTVQFYKDSSVSVTATSEKISSDIKQDSARTTDIHPEKSESFEELSIPDQYEEVAGSSLVSTKLNIAEESITKAVSADVSNTATELQVINMQLAESSDKKSSEPSVSSDTLEIDQFVFIDQTQDIIDDSYNLYDIQESLTCDLNYVNMKGNIEDECTDDSEQEWKRNEDRKNTLNASFLNTAANKKITEDEIVINESKTEDVYTEGQESKSVIDQSCLEALGTAEIPQATAEISEGVSIVNQSVTDEILATDKHFGQKESFADDEFESTATEKIVESCPEVDQDFKQKQLSIADGTQIISESIPTEEVEKIIAEEIIDNIKDFGQETSLVTHENQITTESIETVIAEEIHEIPSEGDQDYEQKDSCIIDESQIMSENISTENSEVKLEEITESLPEVDEESSMIISTSETDNLYATEEDLEFSKEAEIDEAEAAIADEDLAIFEQQMDMLEQQMDMLEDYEISGELSDDNASTHSSVSTQIAVSMKIDLKDSEGDECSLNLEQSENLEDDIEVPLSISLSSIHSDKLQDDRENAFEYVAKYEDFDELKETSEKLTENYEYESEDLEYRSEIEKKENKAELTPTPSFEYEAQLDRATPEIDLEKVSVMRETLEEDIQTSSDICVEESLLDKESIAVSYDDQEEVTIITHRGILQSSDEENADQFRLEPSSHIDVYEKDKDYSLESVVKEDAIIDANIVSEYANLKEEGVLLIQDTLQDENKLAKTTGDAETKLSELESDELDSESLMDEEPVNMSHFYDEWYQNVDSSSKFTLLSAESIYAKYGSAESSESGNESDIDNIIVEGTTDEIKSSKKESVVEDSSLQNEITEKSIGNFDYCIEELSLKKDVSDEVKLYGTPDIYEKSKAGDSDISFELSVTSKLQSQEYDTQVFESDIIEKSAVISEGTEISSPVPERTKTVSVCTDEKSEGFVRDQETTVKNKFSTSKSCQTEDSFEEDIFFDSFDDTFTIPSYIHLPIETQAKPSTIDISIQCELISNEEILSSKKILSSVLQIEALTSKTEAATSMPDSHKELHLRGEQPKQSELASEEKEESSCESFEDSDSDIYIESPSSQDELDVGARRGLLYAEVDSDTGFSSGSECGWTKKREFKHKEFKKSSESSVAKVHTQQISTAVASEKEVVAGSIETHLVGISCDESQGQVIETVSISEQGMAAEKQEGESEKEYVEINQSDTRASPLPREIIERAVTPVAIPQYPSFEDDLVFIEVQENIEEVTDDKQEELVSTTPTVEYFYGPLPDTVKIECPPDLSERFFETTSEFSDSLSFSLDRTESFSDTTSSIPFAEQIPTKLIAKVKSSEGAEDESFAETVSSLKGEIDDSISEYYSLPESNVSLASRASLAESDVFDFAESEISVDNGFIVAPDYLPSDKKSNDEKLSNEKFQSPLSDVTESSKMTEKVESKDKVSQEIGTSLIVSDSKKSIVSSDFPTQIQREVELRDKKLPDKTTEAIAPQKADVIIEPQETVSEAHASETSKKLQPVDSSSSLSVDASVSESIEYGPIISDLVIPFSDAVPSDIVRYLYYDDSITFDDESFHSQSENVDASSLDAESKQKKAKQEIQETTVQTVPEPVTPEITSFETDVKISDDGLQLATEQITEPELCLLKDGLTSSETDLKFPTVEVITSENVSVLPASVEQIHETVVHIDKQVPESIAATDISFEDVSTLPEDSEFQDVAEPLNLKQISPEIPPAPSDIIRYLYYDDDITFDDATQNSFHSQSNNYVSGLGAEDIQSQEDLPELSDIKLAPNVESELLQKAEITDSKSSPELHQETAAELPLEFKPDTSDVSHEESFNKPDSISATDKSLPNLDSSECIENWFDLEETNGKKKHLDSEQYSSTKSSILKDSEQACIPEYILSPKLDGDIPVGKTDIDEVTDISTHFTMTDDSDRFSDIESDTSLNFEEEYISPILDYEKDVEILENEDDEMNVRTPEIKEMPGGFQFIPPEALREKIIEVAVSEEFVELDKFDECVTSSEFCEQQSKTHFTKCLPSRESIDQEIGKEILQEHTKVLKEKFDEKVTSADFCDVSKEQIAESSTFQEMPDEFCNVEIVQKHMEKDLKEEFDECVTSNEFSEVSKEQFTECLTSSKLLDEHAGKEVVKEYVEGVTVEKFSESISTNFFEVSKEHLAQSVILDELSDQIASKEIVHDHVEKEQKEEFDEGITSTDFSEVSKEQFVECLSESSDQLVSKEAIHEHTEKELKEEFDECITSSDLSERSKEHFTECIASSELPDKQSNEKILPEDIKEKTDDNVSSAELCEPSKEMFTECLTSSEMLALKPSEETTSFDVSLEHLDKKMTEQSSECFVFDENGNFPELIMKEDSTTHSGEGCVLAEELKITSETETLQSSFIDKDDEMDISCYASPEGDFINVEQSLAIAEAEEIRISSGKLDISAQQMETAEAISVDKDNDLETSCYTSPHEDSQSISIEVTDNWSDAESKNIEIDESIYDLPQANVLAIQPDTSIVSDKLDAKLTVIETGFVDNTESFLSEMKEIDTMPESQKEEITKEDIKVIASSEVVDSKSAISEITEDLSDKFMMCVESEKSEISEADVSFDSCKISEIKPVDIDDGVTELSSDKNYDICTPLSMSEEVSKQPSVFTDNSLSSDTKHISEVKMETESKISSAMEEKVHIECMSTTSGSQPTFSLSGTMYDTQEVQSEEKSTKEVCSSEEVIIGASSQPDSQAESSEDKILPSAVMEGMQLGSDVDIFESSALNIMEKKYVEVSNLETKYIKLASDSEYIESNKAEISDIPSVIKEKDLTFIAPSEEKVAEVLEFHPLTEHPLLQTEIADTVSVQSNIIKDDSSVTCLDTAEKSKFQSVIKDDILHEAKEIHKEQEVVDFKGGLSADSIKKETEMNLSDTVAVSLDKKLQVTEQIIDFKTISEDIDLFDDIKCPVEIVDFKGQLSVHLSEPKKENTIMEVKPTFSEEQKTPIKEMELEKVNIQRGVEDSSKYVPKNDVNFSRIESDTVLKIVDFKGMLGTDKLNIQQEKDNQNLYSESIAYDTHTTEIYKYDAADQVIPYDPRETYGYGVDELAVTSPSQETYGYGIDELAVTYMPQETYSYGIDELAVTSTSQETYGYGTDELAVTYMPQETYGYGADEQAIGFVSQQQICNNGMMISDSVYYGISSEESSELYSCRETLSSTEDNSLQFYSISDDLEDNVNVTTSEEFTDVPSHLTESSDKWSDVEGDFSFEDAEFDRDKTPTRTGDDIMVTGKEAFKEVAVDIQVCETEIKSKSVVIQEDKIISLDSKISTMIASEIGASDLDVMKDAEPDLQKIETLPDLRDEVTESKTFVLENIREAKAVSELGTSEILEHQPEDMVLKESVKQIDITESDNEKIAEAAVSSYDKVLDTEGSNISLKETELFETSETQSIYEEISSTDSAVLLQSTDNVELLSGEESVDVSVITASEDYIDIASYQLSTEVSEKWSDVENEVENLEKESIMSTKLIPEDVSDQGISVASLKVLKDIQLEKDDTETPLTEHFADIKSIKDQLTTVDSFSLLDAETAFSITHEDTSTDISSQFEKTESEHWLEAETEHSISEVGEDIAFCIEKDGDTKVIVVEYEKSAEEVDAAIQSSETPYASTTSTSSSYSDLENSDRTSDTCADISLQGATTENSDKWSDIEAEGLIDDVLYGNVDIAETLELTDFPQLIKKSEESKDIVKTPPSEDQLKIKQAIYKTSVEESALTAVEVKGKSEEIKSGTESKSALLEASKSSGSFEGPESTFASLTDSYQSSVPTESSAIPSAVTSTGTSDDELTNVTPLDVTTEESDKWSDISGDASLEEIDDESSVSLKASLKVQDRESESISSEFKVGLRRKVAESESIDVKDSVSVKSDTKMQDKESNEVSSELKVGVSKELGSIVTEDKVQVLGTVTREFMPSLSEKEPKSLVTEESDFKLKSMSAAEVERVTVIKTIDSKISETIHVKSNETLESYVEEKTEVEDSSSSKITEESETLDNFTDVPTHTLTSETSDMYCELDSDHSFEEIESPQVGDTPLQDIPLTPEIMPQDIQQTDNITPQTASEYYENSLANEELLENVDDFALDDIPENELEHYEFEEEEYSLSEHFEINEDELIYPLPYNDDWIEQSFELKEYGVEAVFSESGSDIHGLGIANEYDDEDIQRAIDYNLSTFEDNEDNVENAGATESFKTLSNDTSPHIKQEEFETWSTADAPSIEEEFGEQDNILSKIDELLAEDFGLDLYQTESPLKHDEDYLLRDVSTPDETYYKDITQIDSSSLPKDTSLHMDKSHVVADSTAVSDDIILKKDSEAFTIGSSVQSTEITAKKDSETLTIEKDSAEIKDDSIQVLKRESATVSSKITVGDDSKTALKTASESTSDEITVKKDSVEALKIETEMLSREMKRDPTQVLKKESAIVSSKMTVEEDSKIVFKSVSDGISAKKDSIVLKTETEIVSHEIKDDTMQVLQKESAIVSDRVSRKITAEKDLESEILSKSTEKITEESKVSDINEVSSSQSQTLAIISKTSMPEKTEISAVVCDERNALKSKAEKIVSSSEDALSSFLPSDEINKIKEAVQPMRAEQNSSVEADVSFKVESDRDKKSVLDQSRDFSSTLEDSSSSVVLALSDSSKQIKDQLSDKTTVSVTETDSSFDIPTKTLAKSTEAHEKLLIKTKASTESSEDAEFIQSSQQLSESLKHLVTSTAESIEVQSNIPNQRIHKDGTYSVIEQSVSLTHTTSEEQTSADSCAVEVKPDIPKKTKQKSLDSKEGTPLKDESDKKPSLPPKKSKRLSLSDSPSSSFGESLSSSSSVESIGSFESAVADKSRKSSLKSSDEPSMHSLSPEVPARRSRSSKMSSSSSRSTSRDSDNSSSAPSRSSSLKIRRRSSNFIEPEPIDFSNTKRRASIDERMRKLQNEGKCTTKEKAFIAAKLLEMQFEEEDALLASRQCNTVYHAVKFLTQLCEMCNCRFPINLMSSMVHCAHRACRECLKAHFTSLIYDRSVFTLLCPICQTSDITDQNIQEYFTHLEMNLRNILDEKAYDLFQRKLRDEVLTKDPNFHWCSQCSSGFIASPRLKKLYCPDCSAITCAMCHQTWELEHEGVHCERFQQWKDMHTPEPPPAGLVKYLVDRGISCPSCGLVYAQACGGCMMYKCSHCSFEFCGFCIRPVKRGRECSNEVCDSRGLHIHHLHNCLFFLRDKDITEIQMLLEEESITYLTIPPKDQIVKSRCQVREQKNVHGVITEDRCGRDIEPYCAGLCRTHYYEYLAELLRKNNISPLSIMTIQDLQFMLRKSRVLVPEKVKGETSEEYYERLLNLVTNTLT